MITYGFVELGEGYEGDYDPTDPTDVELLRLDAYEGDEEVESLCTNLPVSLTDFQRDLALQTITAFAQQHPEMSPGHIVEFFSHMDTTWLQDGIPARVLSLFGVTPE